MDTELLLQTGALILLFGCSAFFSSSEVALFSLKKNKLSTVYSRHPMALRYIEFLLQYQKNLLVTILVGNTAVNVAASILSVSIILELAEQFSIAPHIALTFEIVVLTFLILIFGEILPKVAARKNPEKIARIFSYPLYWINALLFPLAEFLTQLLSAVFSKLRISDTVGVLSQKDIKNITELGKTKGGLVDDEHDLIQSVLESRELTVEEIMTPRVDVIAVQENTNLLEFVSLSLSSSHSRIPVYRNSIDTIIGLVYGKDIIPLMGDIKSFEQYSISRFIRPAIFVPAQKKIREMFRDFQEKKIHFAVVVDEFGGTLGVITLEDVIQVLIGEDDAEVERGDTLILKLREGVYEVDARARLSVIFEYLKIPFVESEYEADTVGGLILERAGRIPQKGFSIECSNFRLTVLERSQNRLTKIQFYKTK
ncbi:MAG: HlyC/CorC family transporter [Ignavibacteriales bacterium]|nr:MAG: HlyC/CorC family transporter [Ignavibacteriales bacterium]